MESLDSLGSVVPGTEKVFELEVSADKIAVAHSAAGDAILHVGSDGILRFSLFPAAPATARMDQLLGPADAGAPPVLLTTAEGFLALWSQQDGLALRAQVLCP